MDDTDRYVVTPSGPLEGSVVVSGAKNSALKLMAATLMVEGESVLHNVPHIADVEIMCDLLTSMGARVVRSEETLRIDVPEKVDPEAPYELVERMRASVVVLGPLLARHGRARVSLPGGDNFGPRPIDMHLAGLEQMGATISFAHGYVEANADRLTGAQIVLEFPSHTATDNLMMAGVLAEGTTVIENAAREPEVADLATFLNRMGGRVAGAGTSTIEIEGVAALRPAEQTVIPDRVEAATWLAAVAIAKGEITVEGARFEHMEMLIRKMGETGVRISPTGEGLWVSCNQRLKSSDVSTLPYPGVATDYKPLLLTMLATADGVAIVTENVFRDNRFAYVSELIRMGADIRTESHHAVVRGTDQLSGARVKAHDLRAGAALVLAGLVAEGETLVSDAWHIDRGYDDFAGKLAGLGAHLQRFR